MTKDGTFMFKNTIKNPAKFNNWVLVYSVGKNQKYDDSDADNMAALLRKCSEVFGITVEDPGFITVQSNRIEDWKKEINKDIADNGNPQIVLLFFQKNEERFYGELKRFLTIEKKIPSQVVKRRTVSSPQGAKNMSAASKIILQMNAKLGMPLW